MDDRSMPTAMCTAAKMEVQDMGVGAAVMEMGITITTTKTTITMAVVTTQERTTEMVDTGTVAAAHPAGIIDHKEVTMDTGVAVGLRGRGVTDTGTGDRKQDLTRGEMGDRVRARVTDLAMMDMGHLLHRRMDMTLLQVATDLRDQVEAAVGETRAGTSGRSRAVTDMETADMAAVETETVDTGTDPIRDTHQAQASTETDQNLDTEIVDLLMVRVVVGTVREARSVDHGARKSNMTLPRATVA